MDQPTVNAAAVNREKKKRPWQRTVAGSINARLEASVASLFIIDSPEYSDSCCVL